MHKPLINFILNLSSLFRIKLSFPMTAVSIMATNFASWKIEFLSALWNPRIKSTTPYFSSTLYSEKRKSPFSCENNHPNFIFQLIHMVLIKLTKEHLPGKCRWLVFSVCFTIESATDSSNVCGFLCG